MISLIIITVICIVIGVASLWPAIKCKLGLGISKPSDRRKEKPKPAKRENIADVGPYRKPGKVSHTKSAPPPAAPPKPKPGPTVQRLEVNGKYVWEYTEPSGKKWRSSAFGVYWYDEDGRSASVGLGNRMTDAVEGHKAKKALW